MQTNLRRAKEKSGTAEKVGALNNARRSSKALWSVFSCGSFGLYRCWVLMFLVFTAAVSATGNVRAEGFSLYYSASEREEDGPVRRALEVSGRLELTVLGLNGLFELSKPVTVQIGGEVGPIHDPVHRLIVIPYSFVAGLFQSFPEESTALDAAVFVLYHEVGHALIDMLELPLSGEVEEAADALATLLSIELMSDGGRPALAAAELIASQDASASLHPWFNHSKKTQRFRRLNCWLMGSDPGRLGWVAEDAGIDPQDADMCPAEYEEMRNHWIQLLSPYLKR